ncbi:unnamed protein product, partial [Medioppia subpectinata]
ESRRYRKCFEESTQERNFAIIERNGLKQQCTQAFRQALQEIIDLKEQLTRCKRQRDEALKEINQAMAVRIKAAKEMTRLAEENERALTALEGIRQLAEDWDDSESTASIKVVTAAEPEVAQLYGLYQGTPYSIESDLEFVFFRTGANPKLDIPFSKEWITLWTNFAKTGVPTSDKKWPKLVNKAEDYKISRVKDMNPYDFSKTFVDPFKRECN